MEFLRVKPNKKTTFLLLLLLRPWSSSLLFACRYNTFKVNIIMWVSSWGRGQRTFYSYILVRPFEWDDICRFFCRGSLGNYGWTGDGKRSTGTFYNGYWNELNTFIPLLNKKIKINAQTTVCENMCIHTYYTGQSFHH